MINHRGLDNTSLSDEGLVKFTTRNVFYGPVLNLWILIDDACKAESPVVLKGYLTAERSITLRTLFAVNLIRSMRLVY